MTIVGSGKFTYELIEDWGNLPPGEELGRVVAIATDSQDRVYAFRAVKNPPADPPILIFDREGNFLDSWGKGVFEEPHGVYIGPDDSVYLADKEDHVTMKMTLGGRPMLVLGNRGQPSDTGCEEEGGTVLRAGEPFNTPTGMADSPSGDLYVTDGYRNCRVHRFTAKGQLISSWGNPGKTAGDFHTPHSIWVDREGKVYVVDRYNSRVQVFSPTGDFLNQWTDMEYPTGIWMDSEENFYVSEGLSALPNPPPMTPKVSIWDKQGNLLERVETPDRLHWISGDSRGDLYLARPRRPITKLVRRR